MANAYDIARVGLAAVNYTVREYIRGEERVDTCKYDCKKIDDFMSEIASCIRSRLSREQRRFHSKMEWQSKMHDDDREIIRVKLVTSSTSAYEIHLPFSHFCYGSMFDLKEQMGGIVENLMPWLLLSAVKEKKRGAPVSIETSDTPWL